MDIGTGKLWKGLPHRGNKQNHQDAELLSVLLDFLLACLFFFLHFWAVDVFWFYNLKEKNITVDFIYEAEFLTYLVTRQR